MRTFARLPGGALSVEAPQSTGLGAAARRLSWLYLTVIAAACQIVSPATGWAQTISTPHDTIPIFSASPTKQSVQNGAWSSSSTWSPAGVPTSADKVRIAHTVTYDSTTGDAAVIGIDAGGTLQFSTTQTTQLRVGTLQVLPSGALEIGTAANPIPANLTATIIIKNVALNTSVDPDQFGTGLISINGRVTIHGAVKSPTWTRTDVEPRAGHTTLTLKNAVAGWQVGDTVFLPDTRQPAPADWFNANYSLQIEKRTITAISADRKTVTLNSALSFDHRGARDATSGNPATVLPDGTKLLPHVGNLSRNVVIRSETPSGTRGHTLLTSRSDVDIRYAQFQDLGRTRTAPLSASTNHIGRYPLHLHHLWGPVNPSNSGFQFEVVGNAVNDSLKWPIAVHGSHYGYIKQNVVYGGDQMTGSGIAVEDGTETENLFEENFVAYITSNIEPRNSGPDTADGTTPGSAAECFWAAGFNNRFVNNVAASCRNTKQQIVSGPGWKFITKAQTQTVKNPRFRGADMTLTSDTISVIHQHQPVIEFRGNEVYGLAPDGLTFWQLGTNGYDGRPANMGISLVQDFKVWNTYEGAIYNYPSNRMVVDGLVYRVDPTVSAANNSWAAAIASEDYRTIDFTIRNSSIHAGYIFERNLDPLGVMRFENNQAVIAQSGFYFETPDTFGTFASRSGLSVDFVLRNNVIQAWPGRSLVPIRFVHAASGAHAQPNEPFRVWVYDYQGQAGNNFRAYFNVQGSQNIYGGQAPCSNTTTRPEVLGITCAMNGTPPPNNDTPPGAPSNIRIMSSN
jgi:hypothetical protein